jgi:hypothetical protein
MSSKSTSRIAPARATTLAAGSTEELPSPDPQALGPTSARASTHEKTTVHRTPRFRRRDIYAAGAITGVGSATAGSSSMIASAVRRASAAMVSDGLTPSAVGMQEPSAM